MKFSVLAWNIQKFMGESRDHVNDIVGLIHVVDLDIFGVIELNKIAKAIVQKLFVEEFTNCDFAITDSKGK